MMRTDIRSRRGVPLRSAVFVAALVAGAVPGCAFGYRYGGTLLADTRGDGGVAATGGLTVGLATGDTHAIVETLDAGVGVGFPNSDGILTGSVGLEYFEAEVFDSEVGVRVGLRGRFVGWFDGAGFRRHAFGPGGSFTLLIELDDDYHGGHEKMGGATRSWTSLAIELEAFYVPAQDEDGPSSFMFGLGLSYARDGIAEFF